MVEGARRLRQSTDKAIVGLFTILYFLNSQASAPPVPVRGIRVAVTDDRRRTSLQWLPEKSPLSWVNDETGFHLELPTRETLAAVQIES